MTQRYTAAVALLALLQLATACGRVTANAPAASGPAPRITASVSASAPGISSPSPAGPAVSPAPGTTSPAPQPTLEPGAVQARAGAVMAWDAGRKQMVLFGGSTAPYGGGTPLAETWVLDGNRWQQKHPALTPPGGLSYAMAYDQHNDNVVLYSSLSCAVVTWTWDGNNWTSHTQSGPVPGPRSTMAYDPGLGKVLLFGGSGCFGSFYNAETWAWDGSTWTQLHPGGSTPPINSLGGMAWDDAAGRMVYIGGGAGESFGGAQSRDVSVWAFNGQAWSELAPLGPTRPPSRSQGVIQNNASSKTWLVFSGSDGGSGARADTWTWDGRGWTSQQPASAPQPRAGAASAYDPSRGAVLVFGGVGGGYGSFILNDLWAWDGTRWSQLS